MPLTDIKVVFYTSLFLVPGFIIKQIIASFFPAKKGIDINTILEYLMFSLANYFCLSLVYKVELDINKAPCLILVTLVTSLVLGLLLVALRKLFYYLCNKFSLDSVNKYACAWDYMMYDYFNKEEQFLEVILTDGTKKYGIYSCKSYAPVYDDCSDLFLEFETDNDFYFDENSNSLYISKDKIYLIKIHHKKEL